MRTTITAAEMVGPNGLKQRPVLTVEDGRIAALHFPGEKEAPEPTPFHFQEGVLVPAYVDVHIHGCAGHDVSEVTTTSMETISLFLARHGVGGFLPTTVTAPMDDLLRITEGLARQIRRAAKESLPGAVPLGIHLEGPWLAGSRRGVHPLGLLQPPSVAALDRLWEAAEGRILLLTLAPELPGALEVIEHATALGIRCSVGHTDATFLQTAAGERSGARSATHTFNAMRPLNHREPGVLGYVLNADAMYAEIIADGHHVDPAVVKLFAKWKGPDRAVLVTDAMSATGMPDGEYKLGDLLVQVVHGRCNLHGAIAGSTLTLDRAVMNYKRFAGLELAQAVRAASANPSRLLGVEGTWGELAVGRSADLCVISQSGELMASFKRGARVE